MPTLPLHDNYMNTGNVVQFQWENTFEFTAFSRYIHIF